MVVSLDQVHNTSLMHISWLLLKDSYFLNKEDVMLEELLALQDSVALLLWMVSFAHEASGQ